MLFKLKYVNYAFLIAVYAGILLSCSQDSPDIIYFKANPELVNIEFYFKRPDGSLFNNINELKSDLENNGDSLIFATNGGMFYENQYPMGLYIEDGIIINQLNTKTVNQDKVDLMPNFYLNPNGIFYITFNNKAVICETSSFKNDSNIDFATQSGPMLIVDGKINPLFSSKSANYNIRNGVGIMPNGELIFAISKNRVTFFELAEFFQNQGCINALYLDGYISKAYLPEAGFERMDGKLGVLIGITAN